MKFLIPKTGVRQFSSVAIHVSDKVMSELLSLDDDSKRPASYFLSEINAARSEYDYSRACIKMFKSGSKLNVTLGAANRFTIYGYHYNGDDIRAGMEHLKMLYAMRSAQAHCKKFQVLTQTFLMVEGGAQYPELSFSIGYKNNL